MVVVALQSLTFRWPVIRLSVRSSRMLMLAPESIIILTSTPSIFTLTFGKSRDFSPFKLKTYSSSPLSSILFIFGLMSDLRVGIGFFVVDLHTLEKCPTLWQCRHYFPFAGHGRSLCGQFPPQWKHFVIPFFLGDWNFDRPLSLVCFRFVKLTW